MGTSYDKKGFISKDDLDIKKNKYSKNLGKKINSEISSAKRHNSTHIKENPNFINQIKSQIEDSGQENKIVEKDLKTNENELQKNKIFKSLSYEKLERIEESNKNNNKNGIYNNLYDGGKPYASKLEINKKLLEEEENIYKDMENDNSIEEGSDLNSNSNSASNKELQMIDENIKSLFLNSTKSIKEKAISASINEDKSINSSNQEPPEYELNYYKKEMALRNSYYQKLVSTKFYLPMNKPKSHNSLIIFDWDDTLLPTTFLTQGGGIFNENLILSENDNRKIEKLEKSVLNLLNMAITKGDVYIITNAGYGWVEYSAKKFYPNVFEILQKITIISARGEFEKDYPGDSRKWKLQTFLSLQKRLNTKLVTNIICLGDSLFEIEAGRVLGTQFSEAFVKTIKFKEGPKPEELNKQLMLVANQFHSIYIAVKNLTIRVEKKKKGQ